MNLPVSGKIVPEIEMCSRGVNWISPRTTNALPIRECRFESYREYQRYEHIFELRSSYLEAMMELKICSKCKGDPKPVGEFHTRPNGNPYSYCKLCHRKYTRGHYEKNKAKYLEKARTHARRYAEVIQAWLVTYFQTHPCVDCGETDFIVLEFDHRDGVKKEGDVSRLMRNGNLESIKAEVDKCDVRCANCHKRRTARQIRFVADENRTRNYGSSNLSEGTKMMTDLTEFQEKLRQIQVGLGVTDADLADSLSVSRPTLQRWMNGETSPADTIQEAIMRRWIDMRKV